MPPSDSRDPVSDFSRDVTSNPYASPPVSRETVWSHPSSQASSPLPSPDDLLLPGGDERLWTVVSIKHLPTRELWSMTRNVLEFSLAFLIFKVFRVPNRPSWAAALLDLREISEQEIPDQFTEDFRNARELAITLGFVNPCYLTSPTVGPRLGIEMLMTTPDGRIQLTFHRLLCRDGTVRLDETRQGFYSRLAGGRSLITTKAMPEPRPCSWQNVTRMRTKSFEKLLERHRRLLAQQATRPIDPSRLCEESLEEDKRILRDIIERGLLREATGHDIIEIEKRYG
ncbi:hypothetical protein [Aporhodopirellula aestuarii]|nr:hypothetical protein [Aporhodopirellula aestuarii]